MSNIALDIPVTITVEVGRVKLPIKEFLMLQQGSLVTLNNKAKEPLSFYVNGKLYGLCEVVAISNESNPSKEKYGIKILKIFSREELLKMS